MFECIILVGGFGTRLKELGNKIPKPMMPVGGKPFLYILMKKLEKEGCTKIVLSLYYGADYIIERINTDNPVDCDVEFCIEPKPLGTGGAIKFSSKHITSDKFIALNGDSYCDVSYQAAWRATLTSELLLVAAFVPNVERFGKLQIDQQNKIIELNEKKSLGPGFINAGIYGISKQLILLENKQSFSFENNFLPKHLDKCSALKVNSKFVDIGVPNDYYYANQILQV